MQGITGDQAMEGDNTLINMLSCGEAKLGVVDAAPDSITINAILALVKPNE